MKSHLFKLLLTIALIASFVSLARAQTYGVPYATAIVYQNLSASTANLTLALRQEGNGTSINTNYTAAGYASGSLAIGSLTSLSITGSAVLSSNQPVAVVVVQLPPSANPSKVRPIYTAFSTGSATVLLASALRKSFNTTSIIAVQNMDEVANDFAVRFYAQGNTTAVLTDTTAVSIPPGATKYYNLGLLAGLNDGFNGAAVVVATKTGGAPGKAAAAVMELSTNAGNKAASAFEGAATGATTVYMPSAMCNYSAAANNSNFAVQNTNATQTATVLITYAPGGVTQTLMLAPYGKASLNACAAGNAAGWLGAAVITATQPIIAVGKISGGGLSTAALGITAGASRIALPYVRWASVANYDSGAKQRTFLSIQNVGETTVAANTISVRYYDATGNLVSTHVIPTQLMSGAKANSNPNHQDPSNADYEFGYTPVGGSVMVEGPVGSQLAVVARVTSKISATELAGEDYNGLPTDGATTVVVAPYVVRP